MNENLPSPSGSLHSDLEDSLLEYLSHVVDAMKRASGLISLAQAIEDNPSMLAGVPTGTLPPMEGILPETYAPQNDILRAVVVLTHAYLEEFLRTLGRALMPLGSKEVLDDIPLTGTRGRAQNFRLGSLRRHFDKSVEQVVEESVDEHLERCTFNNKTEVKQFLEKLGIKVAGEDLETLNEMMQRRHLIAHRADRLPTAASETYEKQPISSLQVSRWVNAANSFAQNVLRAVVKQATPPDSPLRKIFEITPEAEAVQKADSADDPTGGSALPE
jgi:hypothetical protein